MKVLVIDTHLGLDHAWRLASDNNIVYYFQATLNPYPKITDFITGYGFHENLILVSDFGEYLDKVDLIVITDNILPGFANKLRENGKKVFAPSPVLSLLENDRVFMYNKLQELGIKVPETEIIYGIENLVKFIKKHEDGKKKFWIKLNKIRGNIETFFVKNHFEVYTYLSHAGLGVFVDDLVFLVQYDCDGIEVGADALISPNHIYLPISFTIEKKGKGNFAKWIFKDEIEKAKLNRSDMYSKLIYEVYNFYEKVHDLVKEDNYHCYLCFEGFFNGKDLKIIDITPRFPYPVSSLYPRFINNYSEVLYKVACGEYVELDVDKENSKMLEITGYTSETNIWRPIHVKDSKFVSVKSDGIGFRKAVKYNNTYWFVPDDGVVFTINVKGKDFNQLKQKGLDILSNIACYSVDCDLSFVDELEKEINDYNITL
ncbi:MAG: hypothetical protein QXX12_01955 [Nanopusillaceae archaeon]